MKKRKENRLGILVQPFFFAVQPLLMLVHTPFSARSEMVLVQCATYVPTILLLHTNVSTIVLLAVLQIE